MKWATGRPAVLRRVAKAQAQEDEGIAESSKPTRPTNVWETALTEFELKSLTAYRLQWPNMAYSLNQNGATGYAMHSNEESLHTIIRNCGLIWSDSLGEGRVLR